MDSPAVKKSKLMRENKIEDIMKQLIDQHLAADLMILGMDKIKYREIRDNLAKAITARITQ